MISMLKPEGVNGFQHVEDKTLLGSEEKMPLQANFYRK